MDLGPYTRREVRYRSDDLTVSGVLFVPDGPGPHPAVVLNHGYIDPDRYVSGQGMPREQDLLARRGWVVLHTDYRGHAGSDDVSGLAHELRVGYARDAIAAVKVLRERDDVDPDRVAMLGRSMGGGVTLSALTIEPDIVDAAVIHASVSSRFRDNLRRWTVPERPERVSALEERFGPIDGDAPAWSDLSPRSAFARIEADVLALHGVRDETCPIGWARATDRALTESGVNARLVEYDGEGHTFAAAWPDAMDRTIRFFERSFEG